MSALLGTGALLRATLRRDRRASAAWVAVFALMAASTAGRYAKLFPDERAIAAFVAVANRARALVAMTGPIPSPTVGGLVAYKIGSSVFNMMALVALFGVVRNTRAEEESGRAELLASGAVGRRAPLAAAWLATVIVAAAASAVTALALAAMHLPARSSVALGLGMFSAGAVFAGVAAVAAQLASTSRGANALAGVALGASYLLRLAADAGGVPWLHWLSPEGWVRRVEPFGADRLWVFAVPLVASGVLLAAAFALLDRRDHGAGLWAARLGAATGERLRTPLALAWRLHRGSVVGWAVGMLALATMSSSLASNLSGMTDAASGSARAMFERFGGGSPAALAHGFLWLMSLFVGSVLSLLGVLTVLRVRSEETSGNAELLLSASVSRPRWVASHVTIALLAPLAILLATGLTMGLVHGATVHDVAGEAPRVVVASLVQAPALWVLVGVTTTAVGWAPRYASAIGWGAFLFVNVFGSVLSTGMGVEFERIGRLDPFRHLPNVFGPHPDYGPVAVLLLVAAGLVGLGVAGARRRDVG